MVLFSIQVTNVTFDLGSGRLLRSLSAPADSFGRLALTDDGEVFFSGSRGDQILHHHVDQELPRTPVPSGTSFVYGLTVAADGSRLALRDR